jgi:asparagine synthase (glutamine-hydrolysing)
MLDSLCRHLGRETHRVSMLLHAPEALRELEHVIGCNDEPVRGFDIVVDHRLKGAARDLGVEVLMGGLGSDELFAGKLVHLVFHVQSLLRSRRFLEAARFVGAIVRNRTLRPRFRLAAQKRYFPRLDRAAIELRGPVLRAHPCRYELGLGSRSCHERLLLELTSLSLPALLHYDDRTTSASGLESRYALLDPPLVELVAPMAPAWKLRTGHSKWLLRKAMEPELPPEICWRKLLQPVGDAHGSWLKRDLHAQVEALLAGELASVELGLLDRDGLRRHYAAFCRQAPGAGAISARDVFSWLAIEIWCRRFAAHLRPEPSA